MSNKAKTRNANESAIVGQLIALDR